jgi:hypothetical protein
MLPKVTIPARRGTATSMPPVCSEGAASRVPQGPGHRHARLQPTRGRWAVPIGGNGRTRHGLATLDTRSAVAMHGQARRRAGLPNVVIGTGPPAP